MSALAKDVDGDLLTPVQLGNCCPSPATQIIFQTDGEGKVIKCSGPLQKQRLEYVGWDGCFVTLNSSHQLYWTESAMSPVVLGTVDLRGARVQGYSFRGETKWV